MRKKKLLCVDFEFHNEIYNKIWKRNKHIDVTVISRADMALKLMSEILFDFILTTIVMPGDLDGLSFIDKIKQNPDEYGEPKISIITGLGGEKFYKEVKKRDIPLINRYERPIEEIENEVDNFLKDLSEPIENQYPLEHIRMSYEDKKLQTEDTIPELLSDNKGLSCSKCNSENMKWIRFRSPQETWDMLCGRDSWLLVCTNCMTQYEEYPISLS